MRQERIREQKKLPADSSPALFSVSPVYPVFPVFSPIEDPLITSTKQPATHSHSCIHMDSPFQPSELYASLEEDKNQGLILAYIIRSEPQSTDALTSPASSSLRASAQIRLLEGSFVNVVLNSKGFHEESRSEEDAPVYYETLPNLLGSISPKYKQRWHSTLFSKLLELKASMKAHDDRVPEFLEEATV